MVRGSHARVYLFLFYIITLFTLIILRLTHLSLFSEKPVKIVGQNQKKINIRRGNILDRNGIILASTIPTASAYIYPKHFNNSSMQSLKRISEVLNINIEEISKRIVNNNQFVWLKRHLTPLEQQDLHNLGIPGVYFQSDQKRFYPQKNLFSHIIGLVDVDNNGISGMELYSDKYLKDRGFGHKQNLKTSLDTRIQYIVREELEKNINLHNATGGIAIIMNVNSGEIISSVSLPDFNPNIVSVKQDKRFFNQVTSGVYEMGSVLKSITLAIGIDSGKISINDSFDVSKPIKIDKFQVTDYRGGRGRELSIPEIFMYSSNIGVAHIIKKVGINVQQEYFRELGLLSKTSVEVPEISKPIFPLNKDWRELNSVTMSYGYGISITPVHLIQAFSAIINQGILNKATLIKGKNNNLKGKIVFKKSTSVLMTKLLRLSAMKGIAKKANIDSYLVGAKTGTAEKIIHGRYNKSLNIAFCVAAFPMTKPEYAIFVLIDEPKKNKINHGFATGGTVAAPLISNILKRTVLILDRNSILRY